MRHVEYWLAFDDAEFYTYDECVEYEQSYVKMIYEFMRCYTFYDENLKVIDLSYESEDINDILNELEGIINSSTYVRRHANLSEKIEKFIYREIGTCVLNKDFDEELGLFEWNNHDMVWDKVGD